MLRLLNVMDVKNLISDALSQIHVFNYNLLKIISSNILRAITKKKQNKSNQTLI